MTDESETPVTAWKQYHDALRELHLTVGAPSTRTIAKRTDSMSHTTVNDVLKGKRLPSWSVLEDIVLALIEPESGEVHVPQFLHMWQAVRAEMGQPTPDCPDAPPLLPQEAILAELVAIRKLLEQLVKGAE